MRFVVLLFVLMGIATEIRAQESDTFTYADIPATSSPVVVYGNANLGEGNHNTFLLKQPNAENPLGNPIQVKSNNQAQGSQSEVDIKQASVSVPIPQEAPKMVQENLPVNPQLSPQETPQIVNKQIQDTLYESGGRIYDLQSYPISDIDYIETPNIQPTITTYPPV